MDIKPYAPEYFLDMRTNFKCNFKMSWEKSKGNTTYQNVWNVLNAAASTMFVEL
jgi:hypothetical protein